jgi:hypothetical protein
MTNKFEAKSSGYGMFTIGSKVEVFGGLSQSLFLGNRSSSTIGYSNSFNLGPRTDFSMGPTVSFNYSPDEWDPNKAIAVGARAARRYARYDFSNNKIFSFQVSPEGSSTYATTTKFNCTQGFQVVGGLSTLGQTAFDLYSATINKMGKLALFSNAVMALGNLTALGPAETNMSDSNYKNTGATVALGVIPALINMGGIYAALSAAISVAAHREDIFKSTIHAESVLQLTKELAFIGSAGSSPAPNVIPYVPISGAGLQLKDGKATLSSRNILNLVKPFKKKGNDSVTTATPWGVGPTEYPGGPYIDFNDKQTAAIEVVPQQITAYGQTIKIAAGYVPLSAPIEVMPLPSAGLMNPAEPPSLLLTATGPTAKIQAETLGSFSAIAPSISLATNSPKTPATRGLFVTTVPKPSIELVQSPASKISMDVTGLSLTVNPTVSINLKPTGIVIKLGVTSINMGAAVTTINSGGTKIKLAMGQVMVGNSLKVFG